MDPWDLAAASAPLPSQAQAALALPTFESSTWLPVSEAARERHMLLVFRPDLIQVPGPPSRALWLPQCTRSPCPGRRLCSRLR